MTSRPILFRLIPQILLCAALLHTSAAAEDVASQLGKVNFPTSATGEVQEHFLRGVLALHSFFYEEALEAFQAANRADPGFMMGYWGQAMAHNHPLWAEQDTVAGRAAVAQLNNLQGLPERDKGFVEAVKALYGEGDKPARDQAYAAAMERLHSRFPEDHEVSVFRALSLLGTVRPGEKGFQRQMRAAAIAMDIYQQNPLHPGAAHYIIHSFDDPEHAILALPAARRYAGIAREAPHALHMPAHIFMQLGMWQDSEKSNLAAWNASDAWIRQKSLPRDKRDYHSLHWLMYTHLQQGRFRDAEKQLAVMKESLQEFLKDTGPQVRWARLYQEMLAAYVVDAQAWQRAAELFSDSGLVYAKAEAKSLEALVGSRLEALAAYAIGMAAGDAPEARRQTEALLKLEQKAREGGDVYDARQTEIMRLQVEGRASARLKEYESAIGTLKRAVTLEEELSPPSGPPIVIKPSHELLGEILLEAGQPAEAALRFQASLRRQPNRLRSALGYGRASAAEGKAEEAAAAYQRLQEQLAAADRDLAELAEVQKAEGRKQ